MEKKKWPFPRSAGRRRKRKATRSPEETGVFNLENFMGGLKMFLSALNNIITRT